MEELLKTFTEIFGEGEAPRAFFAGGRINIIGEHTDYNGGHVFPCALTMGTTCLIRRRADRALRFYSVNFPEAGVLTGSLDSLEKEEKLRWCDYVIGMVWALAEAGQRIPSGFDMLISGNIPYGSGLSSSASLEVVSGTALRAVYGLTADNKTIALLGQKTENGFIGLRTGIMDQFAIAMGQTESAIYLDTATLEYTAVPLRLGDYGILIMDTKKKRALAGSKYNERRVECEHALSEIRNVKKVASLGELSATEFDAISGCITDPTERKRARHAVYENERTKLAMAAMQAGDLKKLGELIHDSHVSLRDDYEVSCHELDVLQETAEACEGVLGARMTGAGFGGCGIAIVKKSAMKAVAVAAGAAYEKEFGFSAAFYEASVGGGPAEIRL